MKLQSAIRVLYPPQCLVCGVDASVDFALCADCWREMPFVTGLVCDICGTPLPGEDTGEPAQCDSCLMAPKPWVRGRAALLYDGTARRMVLALKHGDRQDLVRPMARWMANQTRLLAKDAPLLAPVPLHRTRLFTRRFNQSALLTKTLAGMCDLNWCPDLITRLRATRLQEGMTREERHENQRQAFKVPDNRKALILDRSVLLIDDVMTSGATLSACTEACYAAGAASVTVQVLARVARNT